jgi:hypothetical protein
MTMGRGNSTREAERRDWRERGRGKSWRLVTENVKWIPMVEMQSGVIKKNTGCPRNLKLGDARRDKKLYVYYIQTIHPGTFSLNRFISRHNALFLSTWVQNSTLVECIQGALVECIQQGSSFPMFLSLHDQEV